MIVNLVILLLLLVAFILLFVYLSKEREVGMCHELYNSIRHNIRNFTKSNITNDSVREYDELTSQLENSLEQMQQQLSQQQQTLDLILQNQMSFRQQADSFHQLIDLMNNSQKTQLNILDELGNIQGLITQSNRSQQSFSSNSSVYSISYNICYCRQLNDERTGFRLKDIADVPQGNCFIIKQYDDTHAMLDVVLDEQIRSQMISGFHNFIDPVCYYEGQSPIGKNSFDVISLGELVLTGNMWKVTKKLNIKFR